VRHVLVEHLGRSVVTLDAVATALTVADGRSPAVWPRSARHFGTSLMRSEATSRAHLHRGIAAIGASVTSLFFSAQLVPKPAARSPSIRSGTVGPRARRVSDSEPDKNASHVSRLDAARRLH
jgi:hypothetical protein